MGKQWKQCQTLFLGGSKITADGDCSHEIKTRLLFGRKVMTNLDSILKSRDITLPRKFRLVKAMVFPVVMYGCSLSLLQGIFPTQGYNPGLSHCRQILYQLSHKGSPRILEWLAYPFSRGYSCPRNQTQASCIAEGFFTD